MTIYDFNDKEKVTLGMIFRLKFSFSSANIIDTRIEAQWSFCFVSFIYGAPLAANRQKLPEGMNRGWSREILMIS